jgi:hypothetical protein
MFKCLCPLLIAVLSLGNVLRLDDQASYELPFWTSLALCFVCFFLTVYHFIKNAGQPKEKKTSLSALKKTDD